MTPTFHFKILLYYQKEDVYKKTDRKIFIYGQMAISYLAQVWKSLTKFLHVICNSNRGSNMVGATESDMPWEAGLSVNL